MEKNQFEKSIDPARLDRLRGEIAAFVGDFEDEGYHNLEIARALVWVSFHRALREDLVIQDNFLQFLRDLADRQLKEKKEMVRMFTDKRLAEEIN